MNSPTRSRWLAQGCPSSTAFALVAIALMDHSASAFAPSTSKARALRQARNLRIEFDRHYENEDYGAAVPLAEQACSILKEHLGEKSVEHVDCINDLAVLYQFLGNYRKAQPLLVLALAISEETLGPRHLDVASILDNLASLHVALGHYEDAQPLHERALAIVEETLGPEHPRLADNLNNLAHLYIETGRHSDARRLHERALGIYEKMFGPNDLRVARSLSNLANVYIDLGEHEKARPLLDRALSIRERAQGQAHPSIAPVLGNMAQLHREQGEYEKAEALLLRSLSIRKAALGDNHPDIARSLNNLGSLYDDAGRYDAAENLFQESLSILQTSVGHDHPYTSATLNNLAAHYQHLGDYKRARALYEESLFILHTPKKAHLAARIKSNLGALHHIQREYTEAEQLYEEALRMTEQALGPRHQYVAVDLNNLASLHQIRGAYDEAEAFYERSLSIKEETLSPRHPDVAIGLHNLASLYVLRGEHAKALQHYDRALTIYEETIGHHHPQVAVTLRGMGSVYLAQGADQRALDAFTRSADIDETTMTRNLAFAAETRRIDYASTLNRSTDQLISLHLQASPEDPATASLALRTVLRRKGRVQDLTGQSYVDIRRSLPRERHEALDDLTKAQGLYSTLIHRGHGKLSPVAFFETLDRLQRDIDESWRVIAKSSVRARALMTPITIADIQAKLPGDAALVEYVSYSAVLDGRASKGTREERYAAYIVLPHRIDWVDLGPAEAIDEQVRSLRDEVAHRADISTAGRAAHRAILEPVSTRLGATNRLFISPDGNLNLVPFDALVDEYGNYVVERFHIHYLNSGRDLLRPWMLERPADGPVVIVANPKGTDLPGTEQEAALLASLLGNTVALRRDEATETRLRAHERPRILHIATHGAFAAGRPNHTIFDSQQDGAFHSGGSIFDGLHPTQLDNPMLYSWLDLASPSAVQDERSLEDESTDDGKLTAYEVSGLDLRGTELVTLSACDTAQGEYQQGEGIMGLRRAFAIAGAQTQVMSLWKVSDTSTAKLMGAYYHRLLAGEGRSEAMRNSQLEMLRNPETRHPRDWAAFVVVGEWGPLSGTTRASRPPEGPPQIEKRRGCQASIGDASAPSTLAGLALVVLIRRRRRA